MNNNDIMFINFKLKTLEELLKKIIIKVDTIEENFKIFKSDFDCAYINHISEEIQNELDIELHDVNEPQ
jgi:hypothetical protein